MVRRQSSKPLHVTVVADNPQTVEVLHSYFTRVGVTAHGARELDAIASAPAAATAVILFPDDFRASDVEIKIQALRRARPKLLIVLVTAAPQALGAAVEPDGRSQPPLVLPRPAFGWTILDAIRDRSNPPPP